MTAPTYRRTTSNGCRLYGNWTKVPSGGYVEWFTESHDESGDTWFVSPHCGGRGWVLIRDFTDTIGPFPTIRAARAAIAKATGATP